MTSPGQELHTLAGAYVLDAVTDAERSAFAGHLDACPECRDEIRELREVAARLAVAAAIQPGPELRTRLIRATTRVSQLGPVAGSGAASGRGRRRRRIAARPLTLAVAAIVAVAVVGAGVVTYEVRQQAASSQQQGHMIAAVLTAPDAVMLSAKIATGGRATVVMSHRERALVFTAHGLALLPAAKAYELWLMGPGGDKPAGMLRLRQAGMSDPAVISGLGPGDMVAVTIEPAAGSARPTSPPIVLIGMKTH